MSKRGNDNASFKARVALEAVTDGRTVLAMHPAAPAVSALTFASRAPPCGSPSRAPPRWPAPCSASSAARTDL